jgi:hypothetical protein
MNLQLINKFKQQNLYLYVWISNINFLKLRDFVYTIRIISKINLKLKKNTQLSIWFNWFTYSFKSVFSLSKYTLRLNLIKKHHILLNNNCRFYNKNLVTSYLNFNKESLSLKLKETNKVVFTDSFFLNKSGINFTKNIIIVMLNYLNYYNYVFFSKKSNFLYSLLNIENVTTISHVYKYKLKLKKNVIKLNNIFL